ncbi:MAG: hypothetical protein CMJ46_03000 [Planctomyces sp.]|nr:hypothetical protein [Planctomyces sp.]
MELIFFPMFCGMFLLQILGVAFMVWMVIDCAMNEPSEGNDKVVWILVIIFVPLIGGIIYYFVRRPERIEKYGR